MLFEIPRISPLDHIKSNPAMYLPGGTKDAEKMAQMIYAGALASRALEAKIEQQGEWWVIVGKIDWLRYSGGAFNKITPMLSSVNSFHPEIVLTAFASDVLTWWNESKCQPLLKAPKRIAGECPESDFPNVTTEKVFSFFDRKSKETMYYDAARWVAFRL